MQDEGLSKLVGIVIIGMVAVGVLWTLLTSQFGHWLVFVGAVLATIVAAKKISKM